MVYAPAGCVMRDYMPGYAVNPARAPAAAAHTWLINTKIRKGAPLKRRGSGKRTAP
ncbi:hypothetical protein OHB53_03910 [Streptomyces sp. NBC_00056]|uniref:hypothetical protein n=1 Tax=Streptomyces sp. NBC_00063 TaxID=2975638 RepID=UPI0022507FE9|nr:hypothetical protein [Streptomyces sp. NBC_00063]MCX5442240.1 hypothetical protein [Streptomyces sp. NBC_00063]